MTKIKKTKDGYCTDKGVPVHFYDQNNQEIKELDDNDSNDY